MRIYAGYDLEFKCLAPTPAFLLLQVHPSRVSDLETDDKISFSRPLLARELTDAFGNRLTKCVFPAGKTHLHSRFVINDDGLPDRQRLDACQTGVQDLPVDPFSFYSGAVIAKLKSSVIWPGICLVTLEKDGGECRPFAIM